MKKMFSSSVTFGVQSLHCFEMSRFTPGSHLKTCCFPFKVKFFYPFSSSKINCIVFGRPCVFACFNSGQPVVYHQSPCTEGIKGSFVLVGSALNGAKLYNCLNNRIVAVLIFDCGSESRVSQLIPAPLVCIAMSLWALFMETHLAARCFHQSVWGL